MNKISLSIILAALVLAKTFTFADDKYSVNYFSKKIQAMLPELPVLVQEPEDEDSDEMESEVDTEGEDEIGQLETLLQDLEGELMRGEDELTDTEEALESEEEDDGQDTEYEDEDNLDSDDELPAYPVPQTLGEILQLISEMQRSLVASNRFFNVIETGLGVLVGVYPLPAGNDNHFNEHEGDDYSTNDEEVQDDSPSSNNRTVSLNAEERDFFDALFQNDGDRKIRFTSTNPQNPGSLQ